MATGCQLLLPLLPLLLSLLLAAGTGSAADRSVTKVHLMFMNHLDVGFSLPTEPGLSANVINTYLSEYFVRAVNVSRQLRQLGYRETFSYLTHPWMLELFLDCPRGLALQGVQILCPSQRDVAYVERGVQEGAIQWHAGAMNLQYETCTTGAVLQLSLDVAKRLDARFGIRRQFSVLSLRDVPGLTSSALPALADNGILAITHGVNWACRSVAIGNASLVRWRRDGREVLYHRILGGYPNNPGPDPAHPGGLSASNCLRAPGSSEVLCWAFRTDNSGPPADYKEVLSNYEVARGLFPNAEVFASTLERFWSLVASRRDQIPTFDGESGDTWTQGDQADFRRMAEYRAVARGLDSCLRDKQCRLRDPDLLDFSRWIVKAAEHTYGINSVGDTVHYSNRQFESVLQQKNFQLAVQSWRVRPALLPTDSGTQ